MKPPPDPQYRHRFPVEISLPSGWLYHVFSLSLCDVELILAERGIVVSYQTVRRWCKNFGVTFANCLRHGRPRPGDKWHLDGVFILIQGSGAPSIRMVLSSTSWFSRGAMRTPQSTSSLLQAIAERSSVCAAGDRQVAKLRRRSAITYFRASSIDKAGI
jgi:hypothetical protein